MNKNVKMIIELATTLLKNQEKLIEGQINSTVQLAKTLVEVQNTTIISSDEIEEAIRELETRFSITMDTGVLLEDKAAYENKKWYYNSKVENGTKYWDKYEQYLEKEVGLPTKIINKIDESADDVMDVLGNPKSDYPFSRKGLVIGAVQSGKTSNYIALMNKAADSGYKVIILLTGTLEKLRKQTQMRVDEGFVGRNSKDAKNNNATSPIGVGNPIYGKEVTNVSPFTTTENDFNTKEALTISSQNGVVVFVIKKNKSILEKLYGWLQRHNLEKNNQKINYPLLMIDDEADNASINTNDKESDPTTINRLIRQNLALFSQHSYVGFTATPFANIFIDPKAGDESGDEDLFPKDFIYLLNQPSNYVGPDAVYREGAKYSYMLKNNDDVEELLPLKHKNGERLDVLPNSLKEAILLFFITNAIRDLRGDQAKHRSMLVHISRFISVQETVKETIQNYVKKQVQNIKLYGLNPQENEDMQLMHNLFEREFKNVGKNTNEAKLFPIKEEWEDVKKILYKSIAAIQVKTVNSGTATKNLNYEEYDDGLRIITVGGLSLARGLTLEGLMVSYFYRNTRMYDTLMQMGRWFGYRKNYEDLCLLWTSKESQSWYAHIAEATEELRIEIKNMASLGKTPKDYGLRVRSSEDASLIVTASNKMRNSEQMTMEKSLNGQMIETALLHKNKEDLAANNELISQWIQKNIGYLIDNSEKQKIALDKPTLKGVPKDQILELIGQIALPFSNEQQTIQEDIQNNDLFRGILFDTWDVVIATNDTKKTDEKVNFGGIDIAPVQRSFDIIKRNNREFIRMSGSKKRIGSTTYAMGGLTTEEYQKINGAVNALLGEKKNPSQNMYFSTGKKRNPLLVIYPVQLKVGENEREKEFAETLGQLVTGIALGIPALENVASITYKYVLNKKKIEELYEIDDSEIGEGDEVE